LKEKVPQHYSLPHENKWASYFWSLLEKARDHHMQQMSAFTDPRQQQIAGEILRFFTDEVKCLLFGGYPEAERVRICAFPVGLSAADNQPGVSCALIEGSFPPGILTHRDFLGALLGLGIKRETLGDIIYRGEEKAYLFLMPEIVPFVVQSLTQIGRFSARAEIVDPEKQAFDFAVRQVKEISGTVASMRVDAVAGLGYGLSRSRITPLVKGEQLKINYQIINQPSKNVKEGDLISLAGRGRVEVAQVLGESKKGRIRLLLKRFI
jgi:RNA-binding protein YlmH